MSDCRFGVSPVNYPDPDPNTASRGRIADNPNMKNVHLSFPFGYIEYNSLSPLILRIDRERDTSLKRRNFRIIKKYELSIK